jgi:hypothetical protein
VSKSANESHAGVVYEVRDECFRVCMWLETVRTSVYGVVCVDVPDTSHVTNFLILFLFFLFLFQNPYLTTNCCEGVKRRKGYYGIMVFVSFVFSR